MSKPKSIWDQDWSKVTEGTVLDTFDPAEKYYIDGDGDDYAPSEKRQYPQPDSEDYGSVPNG